MNPPLSTFYLSSAIKPSTLYLNQCERVAISLGPIEAQLFIRWSSGAGKQKPEIFNCSIPSPSASFILEKN
jgi:hypothetical protein